MPDTPVTPAATNLQKPGVNKTRTTLLIGGAALVAIFVYLHNKKKSEAETAIAYDNQSFVPVTAENVPGVANAGGSGGFGGGENNSALLQAQQENTKFLTEYLTNSEMSQHEFEKELLDSIRNQTGGGAPTEGQKGTSGGTASPETGGTKGSPPPVPSGGTSGGKKCSGAYPEGTYPDCYANITCGNGCAGHRHSNGNVACQVKVKGVCKWP